MAVFGIRAWWRRSRMSGDTDPPVEPPGVPSEAACQGPVPLDDHALKAYAMQRPEWAEALIQVESARVSGEIRLLSVRLLLGTACGSVLLFSVTIATRVAPSVPVGSATPLTTAVIGAVSAAILTALGAGLGRVLRGRLTEARVTSVSGGGVSPGAQRPPERDAGSSDAP
ncbi:hypothetical protein [Streptomyces pseudovenezuelae]|uniref:hypothetical protein n=1 Tax=Streptomyces pseudovenezuelae TaxID=67350 RepID=UPI002E814B2C|nr:hypothetical protein [Streptomyces pseudovenezuelae]WUA91874.1 hypothetical protein OHO81_33200 [Streptomyces pseudovenezuelae]